AHAAATAEAGAGRRQAGREGRPAEAQGAAEGQGAPMSRDADKGRSRRALTPGERELWSSVTRSIAPLRRARPVRVEPDEPAPAAAPAPPPPAPEIRMPARPREKPALAPLDRRLKQRLARGREAIDASIDLHGLTQAEAHAALTHFLRRASVGDAR